MVITNPPRSFYKELDDFAPIDYGMVDVMNYKIPTLPGPPVVGLMITRGCPFKCTYCDAPTTTGKKIRYPFTRARCFEDIVRLHKEFGVRRASRSGIVRSRPRRSGFVEFCEKLIESGVDDRLALQHPRRLRNR